MPTEVEARVRAIEERVTRGFEAADKGKDILGLVWQWIRTFDDPPRRGSGCDEMTKIRVTLTGSCGVGFEGVTVFATLGGFTASTTILTGGGYYEIDVTDGGPGTYTIEVVGTRVNTATDTLTVACGDTGTITIPYTIKSAYSVCFCGFPLKPDLIVSVVVDGADALNPGTYTGTMTWNSGTNRYTGCVDVPVNLAHYCDGSGNYDVDPPGAGWQFAGDDNPGEATTIGINLVMSATFCTLSWGTAGCTASGGVLGGDYVEAGSSCPVTTSAGWFVSVSWLFLEIPIDLNFKVSPPLNQKYVEACKQVGYDAVNGYFIYRNYDNRVAYISEAP